MEMKNFCKKHGISESQFLGNEKISDSLDLGGLTSIPEGFNPTVGGSLYLGGLTSIPEGFNPTVGGSLYLVGLTSDIEYNNNVPLILEWYDGKYIYCDGRFSEVVTKKGNIYYLKDVNKDKYYYLVIEGDKASHGESIKDAMDSLIYKTTKRDISEYKGIDVDEKLDLGFCIGMYRSITGACEFGVRSFIESTEPKQEQYSVNEIIKLTRSSYGSVSFAAIFEEN